MWYLQQKLLPLLSKYRKIYYEHDSWLPWWEKDTKQYQSTENFKKIGLKTNNLNWTDEKKRTPVMNGG